MSQDALLALARAMSAKGNVSSGDINTLLSPELGYLTGTFYGGQDTGEDDELLWMDHAPNFRKALTLPDTDIRKIIAGEIYRGAAPWDLKRQIEEYTAGQAELAPGLINQEGETSDLIAFANTAFKEYTNYQVAKTKAGRSAAGKDPFVAGGVPSPEMDFAPEQLAPDLFENLAKESVARGAESNLLRQRGKSRAAALEFLQKGTKFNPLTQELPKYEDANYFDWASGGTGKQDQQANFAKKVEGFKEEYLKRVDRLDRLKKGVTSWRTMFPELRSEQEAMAQAQKSVDVYKKQFEDALNAAKTKFGMYTPEKIVNPKGEDRSYQRAEDIRFGRTAQDVVKRSEGVEKDVLESGRKEKWLQDFTSALGMLVQAKARAAGYTPYQETMTARSNFLRAGGL